MSTTSLQVIRGQILHCLREPATVQPEAAQDNAIEYIEDGLLIIRAGRIEQVGEARILRQQIPAELPITDYSGKLIVPGFIDSHIHYPQTDIIAAFGEQLLNWLENYTFPAERRFDDAQHAAEVADFFCPELLRNGVTSALVLGTVHASSVDAIFSVAQQRGLRLIAGKVLMDRNCPEDLRDTPETAYRDSKALIERWHGQDRLLYAITPRFAPTSSEAQLQRAGQLAQEHSDAYIHTHLAENLDEVRWVSELFPRRRSYLDVYDHFGLLRERSVFAHCIHLDDDDRQRMAACGAAIAFCPTANLFLGSGLFDLAAAQALAIKTGLGSDVGGGSSFNPLRTLNEAYKVLQLAGQTLTPYQALYLATLGSARALSIDHYVGNFAPGKEADFVVLDWAATPLLARRTEVAKTLSEKLFALIMLGDDRAVLATHIMGRLMHYRC